MLAGSDLVVPRLGGDSELPQLLVQVSHEFGDPGLDGAVVMVRELLSLGRPCAEKRASGEHQVLSSLVMFLVYQEVLLLGANGGDHALDVLVSEEPEDLHRLVAYGLHASEQRGLLVQRFSGVRKENRGDVKRVVPDEGIAGGVPGRVAAGLEGGPQSAGGEGRSVGLALDQALAAELHDRASALCRGYEGIVLFGGDSGHGLEPVGVMGAAVLERPCLHGVGDAVGHVQVDVLAFGHGFPERLVDVLGEFLPHHGIVEDQTSKVIGYCFHGFFPGCFSI